jgi:phage shock protein C
MDPETKRLTRSRTDRVFAGVCGGLAVYFGVDVVLIRIAYVALTLISAGTGIPLYLVAWIVMPLEDPRTAAAGPVKPASRPHDAKLIIGGFFGVAGAMALTSSFIPWFWHFSNFKFIGPVVLLLIGLIVILSNREKKPALQDAPPITDLGSMPQPPEPEKAEALPKRLHRSNRDRKIAGICSGLGEYFNIDPTIIRILWIVLIFAGGVGLLIYVIMWLAVPLDKNSL